MVIIYTSCRLLWLSTPCLLWWSSTSCLLLGSSSNYRSWLPSTVPLFDQGCISPLVDHRRLLPLVDHRCLLPLFNHCCLLPLVDHHCFLPLVNHRWLLPLVNHRCLLPLVDHSCLHDRTEKEKLLSSVVDSLSIILRILNLNSWMACHIGDFSTYNWRDGRALFCTLSGKGWQDFHFPHL